MNGLVTKEAIQELQKSLQPVVMKLGQGGEYVYKAYYKQQLVYAIQNLFYALFGLVLLVGAFFIIKRTIDEPDQYSNWKLLGPVSAFLLLAFGCALFFICTNEAIGRFINPDYYVLQDLLLIVKK